jgi:hypothetical protein
LPQRQQAILTKFVGAAFAVEALTWMTGISIFEPHFEQKLESGSCLTPQFLQNISYSPEIDFA